MARFFNALRTGLLVLTTSAFVLPTITPANAQHRSGKQFARCYGNHYCTPQRNNNGWKQQQHRQVQRIVPQRRNNNGELLAVGVIGLAVGAIIAGELSKQNQAQYRQPVVQPHYNTRPQVNQFPPAPRQNNTHVVTLESAFQPWSQGWYEWCDDRYRSFNANTGTYRGYDGLDHFCVVK